MTGHGDPLVTAAVVAAAAVWYSASWARTVAGPYVEAARGWFVADPDPIDEIHRQYREDEINEQELENLLAMHMDTRNEKIRDELKDIDGIGGAVASEVAVSFDSVGAVASADQEELTDVQDVGPKRAKKISERFDQ